MDEHIKILYKCIQGRYVKVTWTHKIQEKQADLYFDKLEKIKCTKCWLSVLTTGGAIFSILPFLDSITLVDTSFNFKEPITALLAVWLSYYTLRYGDNTLYEKYKENKLFAAELHDIRNKYEALMADIISGLSNKEQIVQRRDELSEIEASMYLRAPITSKKAVDLASNSLKNGKESITEDEEIDCIVPPDLVIH